MKYPRIVKTNEFLKWIDRIYTGKPSHFVPSLIRTDCCCLSFQRTSHLHPSIPSRSTTRTAIDWTSLNTIPSDLVNHLLCGSRAKNYFNKYFTFFSSTWYFDDEWFTKFKECRNEDFDWPRRRSNGGTVSERVCGDRIVESTIKLNLMTLHLSQSLTILVREIIIIKLFGRPPSPSSERYYEPLEKRTVFEVVFGPALLSKIHRTVIAVISVSVIILKIHKIIEISIERQTIVNLCIAWLPFENKYRCGANVLVVNLSVLTLKPAAWLRY